jgi:hypothetical protein
VTSDARPEPTGVPGGGAYVEQLRVPLRWWALATMFWASMLLALLVAIPAAAAFAVTGVLAGLSAVIFVSYGAARVAIVDGVFEAGRARIPVHLLASPEALDAAGARRVAGVDADARAFLVVRPYVATAVRVRVVDPADPTPYWLVSTRHPGALAAELSAAIGVSG